MAVASYPMSKIIFFVFTVTILKQMMLKYYRLNLNYEFSLSLHCSMLPYAKFELSSSKRLPIPYPLYKVASCWPWLLWSDRWWLQRSFCNQTDSASVKDFSYFVIIWLHLFIDTATRDRMVIDWVLTNVPSAVLSHGVLEPINNFDHNPISIKLNFSL